MFEFKKNYNDIIIVKLFTSGDDYQILTEPQRLNIH